MGPLSFPCRVCGQPTDGLDTYVVCADCVHDFESGHRTGMVLKNVRPYDALAHAPLTPEDEARVRRLLDW
jgi:hypothetical protein